MSQCNKSDVCRWWLRGKCLYGDKCKQKHPPSVFGTQTAQMVRTEYLRQNNEKNKKLSKRAKKHWGKKKRTKKESIFRHWLLDNFGRKLLGQSSKYGILDIAGGKGILSFEFLNLNGIKSTVCDPRQELTLNRTMRAMVGGYLHKNKLIVDQYVDCTLEQCLNRSEAERTPMHLKLFFDNKLINFGDVNGDDEAFETQLDELCDYQWKQFKKFNKEESIDVALIKEGIRADCFKMIDLMKNCSVVIGMHPDFATEFIIDFAMKYSKPFAVLPCCVFPNSFPNRKLKVSGKQVRQYDDFCDYLTQKHAEIKQCTLTLMGGKNKVIYWIPSIQNNVNTARRTLCQLI